MFISRISDKPGELHTIGIACMRFVGSYASVWFNKPNKWTIKNNEVPNAPKYYVDFTWGQFIKPEEAKKVLDKWVNEHDLENDLAIWDKTYHIKYFYQTMINMIDNKPISRKFMEVWTESNWNGKELKTLPYPVKGKVQVLSGLELYNRLPFRIIGFTSQHPLGFNFIILLSNFAYQYRMYKVLK